MNRVPCQGILAYKCCAPVWLPSALLGKVSSIPERLQCLLHYGKRLALDFLQAEHVRIQGHNMAHECWAPPGAGQYGRRGSGIPCWRDVGLGQDIVRGKRKWQGSAPHGHADTAPGRAPAQSTPGPSRSRPGSDNMTHPIPGETAPGRGQTPARLPGR
jgi:hypothetical protein